MPTFEFQAPDGKTYEVGAPEGATQEQAFEILQQQIGAGRAPAAKDPSTVYKTGAALNTIPRQIGLAARYAMTGPAEAAQIFTEPLRQIVTDPVRRLLGDDSPSEPLGSLADRLADQVGLPRPQNSFERTVGTATKLGLGAASLSRGASAAADLLTGPGRAAIAEAAPSTAGATENVLRALGSNPGRQMAGGAGAGAAGQASEEAGGTPIERFGASVVGGLGGNAAAGGMGVRQGVDALRGLLRPQQTQQLLDVQLQRTLQGRNIDFASLPGAAKTALREEYRKAMSMGGTLDEAALARLADIRAVGATPTRGTVTRDPSEFTREENLRRMAANMQDDGNGLPQIVADNNRALIGRLNDLGASRNVPPAAAGRAVVDSVTARRDALREAEKAAWDAAKSSPGYKAPISPAPLNNIVRDLGQEGENVLGFLPKQITDYMQVFQSGAQPFTPQAYRNLQSMLAKASNSQNGNEAYAAGQASRMLRDADLSPIKQGANIASGGIPVNSATAASMRAADAAPGEAIDLVNQARRSTRQAYAYEESNPLVKSVLGEARSSDPERIAKSFILGGTTEEARTIARELGPNGASTVRDSLIAWLKREALSGAEDDVGVVSQAALNRALKQMGDEKLRVFFTAEEVEQMKRLGRVASYLQKQPAGSAVNNSNTSGALIARGLDALSSAAKRVPGGKAVLGDFADSWRLSAGARSAQNVAPALVAPPMPAAARPLPLLLPGVAAGGSLLGPEK